MFDEQETLTGVEALNPGSERALNDVAFSIGFAMMVLLFVVVSSMTALQNLAVNLPETDARPPEQALAGATPVVVVRLETANGGRAVAFADDAPLGLDAGLDAELARRYGAALAGADAVALQIRADSSLSHGAVSSAVFRLHAAFQSLGASRRVTVRYVAKPVD